MARALGLLVLVLAAVVFASGCTAPGQPSGNGIANPASEYCVQQGGQLIVLNTSEGQAGYCKISNNTICEEWAFFRNQGCVGLPANVTESQLIQVFTSGRR